MYDTPLLQDWERAAIKELTDILYQLSFGSFETKEALAERMRISAEAIETVSSSSDEVNQIFSSIIDALTGRQNLNDLQNDNLRSDEESGELPK